MWERARSVAKRGRVLSYPSWWCPPCVQFAAVYKPNTRQTPILPTLGKYRQEDWEFKSSNEASLEYLKLCLSNETKAQPTNLNNNPPQTNQLTQKKLLAKKNVPFIYSINKFLWSQTYRQAEKYTSRSVSTFLQMGEQTSPTLKVTSRWLFLTRAVPPGSSTTEGFSHIENS